MWLETRSHPDSTTTFIAPCAFEGIAALAVHVVLFGFGAVVGVEVFGLDEEVGGVPVE